MNRVFAEHLIEILRCHGLDLTQPRPQGRSQSSRGIGRRIDGADRSAWVGERCRSRVHAEDSHNAIRAPTPAVITAMVASGDTWRRVTALHGAALRSISIRLIN